MVALHNQRGGGRWPLGCPPVAEEPGKEETWADGLQKQVVAELGSRLIFAYLEKSVPDLLKKAYPQFPGIYSLSLSEEIPDSR